MVLFCLWEWKGAQLPIVPSTLFRLSFVTTLTEQNIKVYIFKHVTVTGVYITMFIKYVVSTFKVVSLKTKRFSSGFVFFSSLYYLPQFFQVILGYTPIRAGIFLIPLLVSQMLSSWISVSSFKISRGNFSHIEQGVLVSRTGKYRVGLFLLFDVYGC